MIDEIKRKEQELEDLRWNKKLQEVIDLMEGSLKWHNAKEGEEIGHGNYYINLLNVELESAFMGFGTLKKAEFNFTDPIELDAPFAQAFINTLKNNLKTTKATPCNGELGEA